MVAYILVTFSILIVLYWAAKPLWMPLAKWIIPALFDIENLGPKELIRVEKQLETRKRQLSICVQTHAVRR